VARIAENDLWGNLETAVDKLPQRSFLIEVVFSYFHHHAASLLPSSGVVPFHLGLVSDIRMTGPSVLRSP
jgi:hypothetical protein